MVNGIIPKLCEAKDSRGVPRGRAAESASTPAEIYADIYLQSAEQWKQDLFFGLHRYFLWKRKQEIAPPPFSNFWTCPWILYTTPTTPPFFFLTHTLPLIASLRLAVHVYTGKYYRSFSKQWSCNHRKRVCVREGFPQRILRLLHTIFELFH